MRIFRRPPKLKNCATAVQIEFRVVYTDDHFSVLPCFVPSWYLGFVRPFSRIIFLNDGYIENYE